jgi:hypothetical protein
MLGFYILCNESLVEVDRLIVKVEGRGGSTDSESRRSRWFDRVNSKSKKLTTSRRGQQVGTWKPTKYQMEFD